MGHQMATRTLPDGHKNIESVIRDSYVEFWSFFATVLGV
jgi:hypothetical protein